MPRRNSRIAGTRLDAVCAVVHAGDGDQLAGNSVCLEPFGVRDTLVIEDVEIAHTMMTRLPRADIGSGRDASNPTASGEALRRWRWRHRAIDWGTRKSNDAGGASSRGRAGQSGGRGHDGHQGGGQ